MTLPRVMAVIGLTLLACQPPAAARSATMTENREGMSVRNRERVLLRGAVRVPLTGTLAGTAASGRTVHLVLRGVRASRPPGVLYHLYLDLPAGAKPEADDARYLVALNFYNARPDAAEEELYLSEDVTETVRALQRQGKLANETTITFLPGGTPEGEAVVSRIELVRQ